MLEDSATDLGVHRARRVRQRAPGAARHHKLSHSRTFRRTAQAAGSGERSRSHRPRFQSVGDNARKGRGMNPERATMNRKPVYFVLAKSVINFKSGFGHKLLCDDLTFSTGSACQYSCNFCYVPNLMRKSPHLVGIKERHEEVVIRRHGAIAAMRVQLVDRSGRPKFKDPNDRRVIYSSP